MAKALQQLGHAQSFYSVKRYNFSLKAADFQLESGQKKVRYPLAFAI